jgi:hypothetical protein
VKRASSPRRVWSWSAVRDSAPVEVGLYRGDAGGYVTRVEVGGSAIELTDEEAYELIRWIRDAVQDASSRELADRQGRLASGAPESSSRGKST